MPLSKTRLNAAAAELVAFCPKCRAEAPSARTDPVEDNAAQMRCGTCGDLLELAKKTTTDVPTDTVDLAAICEEEGLPRDALTGFGMTCTHFEVLFEDDAIVH